MVTVTKVLDRPKYGVFSTHENMVRLVNLRNSGIGFQEIADEFKTSYYNVLMTWDSFGKRYKCLQEHTAKKNALQKEQMAKQEDVPNTSKDTLQKETTTEVSCAKKSRKKREGFFDSQQNLEELIKLYSDGMSYTELAEHFGVAKNTCYLALKSAEVVGGSKRKRAEKNIKGGKPKVFDTNEKRKELFSLYLKGWTYKQLAEHFKASTQTCYKEIKKAGLVFSLDRERGRMNLATNEEFVANVAKLYQEGNSVKDVAKHLNVSLELCYRVLKAQGFEFKTTDNVV